MDIHSPDLPKMIFKKSIRIDSGELSMDADMIRLLFSVDESKTIGQVAKEVGMNLATLRKTLRKLLKLDLLEPVQAETETLGPSFVQYLRLNLIKAVGPMGEFLIEDTLDRMNLSPEKIPAPQAAEIISALAREIPAQGDRLQFQRVMIGHIPR